MTTPRLVAEPIDPDRRRRLKELAEWHSQWVDRNLASTPFDQAPEDYNVHYVDMSASARAEDEFQTRAREIMGIGEE